MVALKEALESALAILRALTAASDACPPFKGAAGGVLHIAELIKVSWFLIPFGLKPNCDALKLQKHCEGKREWADFAEHVGVRVAWSLYALLECPEMDGSNLEQQLRNLKKRVYPITK